MTSKVEREVEEILERMDSFIADEGAREGSRSKSLLRAVDWRKGSWLLLLVSLSLLAAGVLTGSAVGEWLLIGGILVLPLWWYLARSRNPDRPRR